MDWNETVIPVRRGDEGFDVSPDGRERWTADALDGTPVGDRLTIRKVTSTLDGKALGANRLKLTPDGKFVLISRPRDGDLLVYDAASHKEFKRVPIGHGAADILNGPGWLTRFYRLRP